MTLTDQKSQPLLNSSKVKIIRFFTLTKVKSKYNVQTVWICCYNLCFGKKWDCSIERTGALLPITIFLHNCAVLPDYKFYLTKMWRNICLFFRIMFANDGYPHWCHPHTFLHYRGKQAWSKKLSLSLNLSAVDAHFTTELLSLTNPCK